MMRSDHLERIIELEEKLVETFLIEADPDEWPGHGIAPAAMDRETRGDQFWCKRNAAATIALIARVQSIVHAKERSDETSRKGYDDPAKDDINNEIQEAEKEAAKLMKRIQGEGKAQFKKAISGKS